MISTLRQFARRFGRDITPFPGGASHWPQLTGLLGRHGIDLVFDIGANVGQYARALRTNGYGGRIISFEPVSATHAALCAQAAGDPLWEIAPRTAIGASQGEIEINISAESDMSSALPLTPEAHERFASTRMTGTETAPLDTLANALAARAGGGETVFVKIDTQGFEAAVLDGLAGAWERVTGLQLELSIQPIYDGQPDHLGLLQRLEAQGLRPHLVIPGYFSRHYGRMLEYDVVCFRE